MKSGNGRTRMQASTVARQNTVAEIRCSKPGNFTQYVSLLGSVAEKNNWKLVPSIVGTFQKNQNSGSCQGQVPRGVPGGPHQKITTSRQFLHALKYRINKFFESRIGVEI